MKKECKHESATHITLSPWSLERDFICRKCGRKKVRSDMIVPLVYTGH